MSKAGEAPAIGSPSQMKNSPANGTFASMAWLPKRPVVMDLYEFTSYGGRPASGKDRRW